MELTLYLAFIAGLVSFISPCLLPLVPAYIGYMGGRMTHTVATSTVGGGQVVSTSGWNRRFTTLIHSLFFVAGFAFVFVTIGLLSTAFISVIGGANISTLTDLIGRLGGVVIILFGLHFMGVLPNWLRQLRSSDLIRNPLTSVAFALLIGAIILWGFSGNVFIWDSDLWEYTPWAPLIGLVVLAGFLVWLVLDGAFTGPAAFWANLIDRLNNALYADTRRDMQMVAGRGGGYGGSVLMGVVFSAGWTPCIGPVYGAVLTMAANGGDVGQAGGLLAAYSLGLGIPFMLTALALDSAQNILRRLQRHMHKIELVSGAFLILIGIFVASGQLQSLSNQFAGQFADFSVSLEESVLGLVTGQGEEATNPSDSQQPADADETRNGAADLVIVNPETSQAGQLDTRDSASPAPTTNVATASVELNSITGLAAESGTPSVGISLGNFAPDFETVSDIGQPVRLSDYRGQVVLLNFWATWCGPCRVEMPEFEAVYNKYRDQGFIILAVNNQETNADVQAFRAEVGVSFPLVMDARADVQTRYNIFSYPSTFLLGRDGTIIARSFGALTAEQIDQLVGEALAS